MMGRSGVAIVVLLLARTAWADVPRGDRLPAAWEPGRFDAAGTIPYNTVFLNRCASGCSVTGPAIASSINNTWDINGPHTLTAFPYDDATWTNVVACVKGVFEPFLIDVVETDPGTAPHFEVMVAGRPTDLGLSSNLLGVAPGGCTSTYMDNALVFAFATSVKNHWGATCGAPCINEMCWVVAQELAHAWASMDHVVVAADPLSYFEFSGRRYFQNTDAQCGSDCRNGLSPEGLPCSGPGTQSHRCLCTTSQTQNSYALVGGLFGLGPTSPPTVKIVGLTPGQSVMPGVSVVIDATDNSGEISKVELVVDGEIVGTLMSPPFVINTPDTLANGTRHIEAIAYDPHQTPGKATVDVVIGPRCESDCADPADVCIGGRCVAGTDVDGGLGSPCTQPTDCISNRCASDGAAMYCVEPCMVGQCPGDFGCRETGDETVCWPGYDDGSGGCGCHSSRSGGPAMLLLVLVLARRRVSRRSYRTRDRAA